MLSFTIRLITFISICMILTSCNEQYSEASSSSGPSPTDNSAKSLSTAGSMKWATATIGENGLDVFISHEMLAEFAPEDYVDGLNPAQQMLQEWNNSIENGVIFNIDSASDENSIDGTQREDLLDYNDGIFGIYKHETWFPDVSRSALAITQFFGKRINANTNNEYLELIHADVIVNFSGDFNFSTNGNALSTYDLQSVILHELGHFIGLAHANYNENSVMVPYLDPGTEKRSLYPYDKITVNQVYDNQNSSNATTLISSALSSGARSSGQKESEATELVQGIIELMASGECNHYINGELIHTH